MRWFQAWRENRRFDRLTKGDVKLFRESLIAIREIDPALAETLRMRMSARVAQPVTTWDEFVQKREDVLSIVLEGLDYMLAQP